MNRLDQASGHGRPHPPSQVAPKKINGRSRWVFAGFVAMALVLFAVEHRTHLLGWLPWLFVFACPLMHFFMHRGHGHGGHRRDDRNDQEANHE